MLVGIIITVAVLLVIGFIVSSYNSFVKLRNNVEESFSTMDVYLKKRYDLIPNLVETVKGYAKHESSTLENVIAARNAAMKSSSLDDKLKNENALTGTLKSLFAVSEAYPELKANQNFLDLQKQLQSLEVEISGARKYYNANVKVYNVKVEIFPSNIIAGWFKFEKKPLFEIDAEERKNVKVKF